MKISANIVLAAASLMLVCAAAAPYANAQSAQTLKDAFPFWKMGAAVSSFDVSGRNPKSQELLLTHFNAISPDNDLKPESLHPQPDVWTFDRADRYVAFGQENGLWMLGHTLCWHNQTPEFFWNDDKGQPKTRQQIFDYIETYIKTVCTHFLGKVNAWDVINEIVSEEGGYRDLGWVHALGNDPAVVDEFVKHVFRCAAKYAPDTELYYNEFNVWRPSKLAGVIRLVKMLQADGIRIDGVGIQSHWGLGYPENHYIDEAIDQISALGVKVMITELDVDVLPISKDGQVIGKSLQDPQYQLEEFEKFLDPYKDGLPAEVEDQLAARYEELFRIFYKHRDQIDRVTFWGLTDGGSWKNGSPVPRRTNYPLLFTRDYTGHKAFDAVVAVPDGGSDAKIGAVPVYPFRNPDLPIEERVDDLLGRLTLEEKIAMMQNSSKAVDRLGIPAYDWWNEALHGVARAGVATVFPQAIGMAATFDPEEHLRTFSIISDEARAKHNEAVRNGNLDRYFGLSFWTPNINIFRDPRWGRGQETYGEDPFLTSVMGKSAVRGLQGDDPTYYKSHACAKHFAVHSGPESIRHSFDARVSLRDLWETYLPAFKALVTEADVQEVMGAYNRFDGEPCCSSDQLLVDILREKWHYQGMVVSDCGAIDDFYGSWGHKTHPDPASASADAVVTGTDVECGNAYSTLSEAIEKGYLTEADIDVALRRVIKGWIELGMLDDVDRTPWADIPYSVVASDEHAEQALNVARKSMVLLKNDGVLPVRPGSVRKIAVFGPNAADSCMMLGNYNGDPRYVVTVLDGIRKAYPDAEVTYERGCDLVEGFVALPKAPRVGMQIGASPDSDVRPLSPEHYTTGALSSLTERAAEADLVVFVGGISPSVEGEQLSLSLDGFAGGDRERIELPDVQSQVLKALHASGKPVVFVLCTGSAIALERNESDYDALICAWYGGQEGGTAVADVMTGRYNPSGRLPVTFYKSTSQLPSFIDYSMKGRTYRYMTEEPLYAFGYGLSYTDFEFKASLSSRRIKAGQDVVVKVRVSNTGPVAGNESVQVYVKRLDDADAPLKSLKGLATVSLAAGGTETVYVTLPASTFEYYDEAAGDLAVKPGRYQVLVGDSSRDCDLIPLPLVVKF